MGRARGPKYSVPFRRRREGKTDYKKRLALVKSGKPRLVFRRTNRGVIVQIIEFSKEGDKTLIHISNKQLKEAGWVPKRNRWTAYIAGYLAAKKALEKGIAECVFDMGLYRATKGAIAFATLKGAVDGGLKVPFSKEMAPEITPPKELKAQFENIIKGG